MILNLSAVQFPHLQNEGNDNACFMHLRVVRIKLYDKVIYLTCLVLYKYIYIFIYCFLTLLFIYLQFVLYWIFIAAYGLCLVTAHRG